MKQVLQLNHKDGAVEDWFSSDDRIIVSGVYPQNFPARSLHELGVNDAIRQFVLMITGEGWSLNSDFSENWHSFIEKSDFDMLEREIKDLRDELLAADEEIKKKNSLLDKFYEYGLGIFDIAISHIIHLNHKREHYRSIAPFEEALDEYNEIRGVAPVEEK